MRGCGEARPLMAHQKYARDDDDALGHIVEVRTGWRARGAVTLAGTRVRDEAHPIDDRGSVSRFPEVTA